MQKKMRAASRGRAALALALALLMGRADAQGQTGSASDYLTRTYMSGAADAIEESGFFLGGKCDWYAHFPWNVVPAAGVAVPACLSAAQVCCSPMTPGGCARRSDAACYRGSSDSYATITTLPMGFYLRKSVVPGWLSIPERAIHELLNLPDVVLYYLSEPFRREDGRLRAFGDTIPDAGVGWVASTADASSCTTSSASPDDACPAFCYSGHGGAVWAGECLTSANLWHLALQPNSGNSCQACTPTAGSAHCLGAVDARGADSAHTACAAASSGVTDACLQNRHSVSMPLCSLVGGGADSGWGSPVCLNDAFMRAHGLASVFAAGDNGAVPTDSHLWVGLKLPTSILGAATSSVLQATVVAGAPNACANSLGSEAAKVAVEDSATWNIAEPLSLHGQSIVLQFKTAAYTCGVCASGEGVGRYAFETDVLDIDLGVARCRKCEPAVEIARPRVEYCAGQSTRVVSECAVCPQHEHVSPDKRSDPRQEPFVACVQCPDDSPYRPYPTSEAELSQAGHAWRACGRCAVGTMFNRLQEPPCEALARLELDAVVVSQVSTVIVKVSTSESRENYHSDPNDFTSRGFDLVPVGFFLDRRSDPSLQTIVACDGRCEPFEYSQLCGKLHTTPAETANAMFVRRANGEGQMVLSSTLAPADIQNYEIVPEGQCTSCTPCPHKSFNGVCSSITNSAGSCAACTNPETAAASCKPTDYLHHSSADGCEQTQAREDYSCRDCEEVEKFGDAYYLVIGCGVYATGVVRWQMAADEVGPLEKTCTYGAYIEGGTVASNEAYWRQCSHQGRPHRRKIDVRPRFWGPAYDYLPYCPPGWRVALDPEGTCTEAHVLSGFQRGCCTRCQGRPAGMMQAKDWAECAGSGTEDTQQYVGACESGRYRVEGGADGTSEATCAPCTQCG